LKTPKDAGAVTSGDYGVFLVGAAIGGIVDATLNSFGFAEPMVVAGLTGTAALGIKRLLLDTSRTTKDALPHDIRSLRIECHLLEIAGRPELAHLLTSTIEIGKAEGLTAREIVSHYERIKNQVKHSPPSEEKTISVNDDKYGRY